MAQICQKRKFKNCQKGLPSWQFFCCYCFLSLIIAHFSFCSLVANLLLLLRRFGQLRWLGCGHFCLGLLRLSLAFVILICCRLCLRLCSRLGCWFLKVLLCCLFRRSCRLQRLDLCQVFRHIFLRIFIHFFKLRLRNCYKY